MNPVYRTLTLLLCLTLPMALFAQDQANTVVLDETGVANLRIETITVEEADFEETIFALGRLMPNPGKVAAVTSRVSGRVHELKVQPGDQVQAGAVLATIESRQPGNPPPVIPLEAPISGLVTQMEVRLGDPVEPENALLEITDLSEMYAVARIPEAYAGRIKAGAKAHIRIAAVPDEQFTGTLLRFGIAADVESGTIDAIFTLQNPSGQLRSGMRAEFSIVLSSRENVMSVPRSALQGDATNRFLYVKDFDIPNAFVKTPVVVGQVNDRAVEILSGLLPADEVVTRGAYSLAFAGGSSISLKEALDAAHGHEHAADGSELTDAQRKEQAAKDAVASGAAPAPERQSHFWMIVSGVLFLLLIISALLPRHREPGATSSAEGNANSGEGLPDAE